MLLIKGMNSHTSFDYLTTPEIKQFLRVIEDPRDRAIVVLFLSAGMFLQEVIHLQVSEMDWENRLIKLNGKRHRDIPLNDEAYNALLAYHKTRPKTPVQEFFLTEKGAVKGLSDRSVDHIIRHYGIEAGLQKKVSAQVLRGGFAVRLFEQGLSLKEASEILGISDYDSLKRYQEAAQEKDAHKHDENPLENLDTRPELTKFVSKLFPQDPPSTPIPDAPKLPQTDTLFGRENLVTEITTLMNKGQSTLLVGPLGIGKTQLLKHLSTQNPALVFFESPIPFKQFLKNLCENVAPNWEETCGVRASIPELMTFITSLSLLSPPVLVVDHLDRLKAADAENFVTLMAHFTVLAATEKTDSKLQIVWWKFKEIEVPPLETEPMKALIAHLTQSLSITDYKMLENKILSQANGYPLAAVDMVNQICHTGRVQPDAIRDLSHDVGIQYRDWTWALMVFWSGLVMCRFVALGTHSFEGYILAGFGTATFGLLRYLLMRRR